MVEKLIDLSNFPDRLPCITLWPEWALAIKYGKDIENRSWGPPADMIGQWFGIHAGKTIGGSELSEEEALISMLEMATANGVIIEGMRYPSISGPGIARLRQAVIAQSSAIVAVAQLGPPKRPTRVNNGWHVAGQYGFPLLSKVDLPSPVKCRGAQKFWRANEADTKAVWQQLVRMNEDLEDLLGRRQSLSTAIIPIN